MQVSTLLPLVLATACLMGGQLRANPVIKTPALEVAFSDYGTPSTITFRGKGDPWVLDLDPRAFWSARPGDRTIAVTDAKFLGTRQISDALGETVVSDYLCETESLRVSVTVSALVGEPGRLRINYDIYNAGEAKSFRFGVASMTGLPSGPDCKVVYPLRGGVLKDTEKLPGGEKPAPGMMWMQWMGYVDGAHGFLSRCDDRQGNLKFAQYGQDKAGMVRLNWSDIVTLTAGETFRCPYDYVWHFMDAPDAWNDLTDAYAAWAREQTWLASVDGKLAKRPALATVAEEGIVKIVGIGALSKHLDRWEPLNEYLPREQKEKMISTPTQPDRWLARMRTFEALYDVRPAYRYDGWWGRFDSEYPFVLPIHPALGGNEAFAEFMAANEQDNRLVMLHNNPVQYDIDNDDYDEAHVCRNQNGDLAIGRPWSGNNLAMVSPRFAVPDCLKVLFQLKAWRTKGMFWDVIGAVSPRVDYNPAANYYRVSGAAFQQALYGLFAALRDAAPDMVFGTEDGQEMMLPYFDWTPNYCINLTAGENETWIPLDQLVYGDCFVNAVGIEANSRYYSDEDRIMRRLYGSSLGIDGRSVAMTNYTPVIQQIFEVNRVLAPIHNRRMRRWLMDPTGWRAAVWDNAVVIGNVDCETPLGAITVQTPFGTVTYENLRKNGFAILTQDGHWVLWGGGKLSLNGELLAASSSDESALVFNRHHLSMASYGFFDPKKEPERKLSDRAWTLSGSSLSKVLGSGNLMAWPSQEPYVLAKKGDSFECPAPGWKQTVRTK